jgi:ribose transport system permease protein
MSRVAEGIAAARRRSGLHQLPTTTMAVVVLVVLLLIYANVRLNPFSSFTLQELSNISATLAILAVGQTLVVISGGFDFSAVAVLAFLNCLFVTQIDSLSSSSVLTGLAVLAAAVGIGAVNGVLVGYLRVQSIIATIAMFFVLSGGALALLDRPGGSVSSDFTSALSGTWGPIPASAGVVGIVAVIWLVLARLRFGHHLYAIGSDARAAYSRGVPVQRTIVLTYALAGLFYGIAALNYTASTASGDPRISFVLLGQMFVAVVIGGTVFGGGRGGAIGSILGALCLALLESVLFAFGVSDFYTGIVFGLVLVLVVLPGAIGRDVLNAAQRLRRPSVKPPATATGEIQR